MESENIISQLMQLLNTALFMEKKKRFNYEGVALFPSEIHIILETNGDVAVNATHIAERLGITKGAVSQTLSRLEKKGIVQKTKDPFYKNELSISLTPLGKQIYAKHVESFQGLDGELESILSCYSEGEKAAIYDFLSKITNTFKHI